MNYVIEIAYDGSKFYGFQRLNEEMSVQKALEEALKTSKVINKTQLKVPTIYSVTQTKNVAECVGEFVEGETLFSILKQNSTNYKNIIDEFLLLQL